MESDNLIGFIANNYGYALHEVSNLVVAPNDCGMDDTSRMRNQYYKAAFFMGNIRFALQHFQGYIPFELMSLYYKIDDFVEKGRSDEHTV